MELLGYDKYHSFRSAMALIYKIEYNIVLGHSADC